MHEYLDEITTTTTGENEASAAPECEIQSTVCQCIAKMTSYNPAVEDIARMNFTIYIMSQL